MSGIFATYGRELRAFFVSPLAYVILALFLVLNGIVFGLIISYLTDPRGTPIGSPLGLFFGNNFLFWIILLLVCPLISMRLLSEERRSGTIEMLMTAPVTEGQVVTGKFLAALTFYAFLWAPTLSYALIVNAYDEVDWGPVASGYLGILGLGSLMLSLGMLASALSRSQIVAATCAFTAAFLLLSVSFVENLVLDGTLKAVLEHLSLVAHMEDFARGVVDTRRLVYYVSASVFFLFLSARTLEANKWR